MKNIAKNDEEFGNLKKLIDDACTIISEKDGVIKKLMHDVARRDAIIAGLRRSHHREVDIKFPQFSSPDASDSISYHITRLEEFNG